MIQFCVAERTIDMRGEVIPSWARMANTESVGIHKGNIEVNALEWLA